MQRGVLKLTGQESKELINALNLEKYIDTPLLNKLTSIDFNQPEVEILISEDEIEKILDEIGMPPTENTLLTSAVEKINNLMMSFRS